MPSAGAKDFMAFVLGLGDFFYSDSMYVVKVLQYDLESLSNVSQNT